MTIASEIQKLQTNLTNSYTKCNNKGATMPASENFDNLPDTIDSITTVNNTTLSITPSTSAQSHSPESPYTGFGTVSVSAVTYTIDPNITANNIKSGVSILGVQGNVVELKGETRSVSLTNSAGQTFTPTSGKNGITSITVTPNNQAKTITPTTSSQTINVPSGYSGHGTLTVNAVTSAIDSNIQAGNIKQGVSILGVTGTLVGGTPGIPRVITLGRMSVGVSSWDLSGVTSLADYALYFGQYANTSLRTITGFTNLQVDGSSCMYRCFYNNTALLGEGISLTGSVGASAMYQTFYGCNQFNPTTFDFSGVTSVGASSFYQAFYGCPQIRKPFIFDNLTTITTNSSFYGVTRGCTRITDWQFPKLETISGSQTFYDACEGITVKQYDVWHPFPKLKTVNSSSCFYNFRYYNNAHDIVFDSLETLGTSGNTNQTFLYLCRMGQFYDRYNHTDGTGGIRFPVLKTIGVAATGNRQQLAGIMYETSLSGSLFLPELETVHNSATQSNYGQLAFTGARRIFMPKVTYLGVNNHYTLGSSTDTQELHFGKENQATIQAMSGYSSKFGASNATIYFDLINHITVDGVVYTRQGKNCDYDNKYYSWANGDNVIYTTEEWTPAVGDNTYTKSGDTYTATGNLITAVS